MRLIVQAGALARGGLWDASSTTHHSAAFSSGEESFSSKIRRVGVSGQDPPLGGGWSSTRRGGPHVGIVGGPQMTAALCPISLMQGGPAHEGVGCSRSPTDFSMVT